MEKTTLYLPEELKRAVRRAAKQRATSEAEVIREAIRAAVVVERPRPSGALFASPVELAEHVDEALAGFGDR
jgi:plasmid stability protein